MNKMGLSTTLLAAIFGALLCVTPASAQATRTWVSGVGDDANPCSRTAPCKTFAGAISKTAAGGEINVLDPGGFGAVTINKSLSIRSTFEAGVLVSGTNGIVVNAQPTDVVVLEGLDFEGLGTGLNGLQFLAGKAVYVLRCTINHFSQNGINHISSTANARVIVKDSTITNNAGVGISVTNGGSGLAVSVLNTLVDGNGLGLQANGGTASIGYAYSTVAGSSTALNALNGGLIASFGVSNTVGSSVIGGSGSPTFSPFK